MDLQAKRTERQLTCKEPASEPHPGEAKAGVGQVFETLPIPLLSRDVHAALRRAKTETQTLACSGRFSFLFNRGARNSHAEKRGTWYPRRGTSRHPDR